MHSERHAPDDSQFAARLRRTADALSTMPQAMASSLSVTLPAEGHDAADVVALADQVAHECDLVASVDWAPPLVTVQFVRARPAVARR